MSLRILTINPNLLMMQDTLSLTDKKEEKNKQAITKLENHRGEHLQINITNLTLKASQCLCLGGCTSAVFKQCPLSQNHTPSNPAYSFEGLFSIWHLLMIQALKKKIAIKLIVSSTGLHCAPRCLLNNTAMLMSWCHCHSGRVTLLSSNMSS